MEKLGKLNLFYGFERSSMNYLLNQIVLLGYNIVITLEIYIRLRGTTIFLKSGLFIIVVISSILRRQKVFSKTYELEY